MVQNRKRPQEEGEMHRLNERIAIYVSRPRKPWSTEALLGGFRKLYNNDSPECKSAEQAQTLTLVLSWTEQLVIVLPTGSGKSLIFVMSCIFPDASITVLIAPLVAIILSDVKFLTHLSGGPAYITARDIRGLTSTTTHLDCRLRESGIRKGRMKAPCCT